MNTALIVLILIGQVAGLTALAGLALWLKVGHDYLTNRFDAALAWTRALLGAWLVLGAMLLFVVGAIIAARMFGGFGGVQVGNLLIGGGGLGIVVLLVFTLLIESRRTAKQTSILWILALSAEANRSLIDELDTFALGEAGWFGRRARRAADLMESGYTLSAALEATPGLVPATAVCQIRLGEASGALAVALRRSAVTISRTAIERASGNHSAFFWIFIGSLGLVLLSMWTSVCIYIMPKFKRIFSDFGLELPDITLAMLNVSDFYVNYELLLIPMAWPLASFVMILIFQRLAGRELACTWPLARMFPRLATPHVLRTLSLAVRSSRPLDVALTTLATAYPERTVRFRLQRICEQTAAGDDLWMSLQKRRLLRPAEVELFHAADRAGNLGWALDEIAEGIERRQGYRLQVFSEILQPAIVVAAGVCVLFVELAIFIPIVSMLERIG